MSHTTAQLDELLAVPSLNLPARPRVERIDWYPFTDSIGDPALRITVVLDEQFGKGGPGWSQLKPIQEAIDRSLRNHGISDFPYIRFVTSEEFTAEKADR
jgi:hypothetical protein